MLEFFVNKMKTDGVIGASRKWLPATSFVTDTAAAAGVGVLSSADAMVFVRERAQGMAEASALIERLRPDVLIKGSDYTREGVVGGDLVESWGGAVRLATFEDGYSTTRTIEKMKDET